MITVNQLHPLFFGEIVGADLTAEPTEALRETVENAMERHGVCVVRQGPISDAQHIRFARLFGPLELPPGYGKRPAGRMAPELFFAGNLDAQGNIKPLTPANRDVSRGVECPPPEVGGDTLFIDLRAAYADLPDETKAQIEGLTGIHDFWLGRQYAGLDVSVTAASWACAVIFGAS